MTNLIHLPKQQTNKLDPKLSQLDPQR